MQEQLTAEAARMADANQAAAPMPRGISRAYGQIMRQTESPREMEYRVLSQITATMETLPDNALPGARAEIIHRNRELWDCLGFAVLDDNNQLPADIRVNIAGIALWVRRESSRVLRQKAPLGALIEINKIIMGGLKPGQEGA